MLLTTDLIDFGYTIRYVAKNLENMIGLSYDKFYTMLKDKESDKLSLVSAPLDSMEGAGLPSTLHIHLFDNLNAFQPYDSKLQEVMQLKNKHTLIIWNHGRGMSSVSKLQEKTASVFVMGTDNDIQMKDVKFEHLNSFVRSKEGDQMLRMVHPKVQALNDDASNKLILLARNTVNKKEDGEIGRNTPVLLSGLYLAVVDTLNSNIKYSQDLSHLIPQQYQDAGSNFW